MNNGQPKIQNLPFGLSLLCPNRVTKAKVLRNIALIRAFERRSLLGAFKRHSLSLSIMIPIPENSTQIIAQWLAPSNTEHQQLLSQCSFKLEEGELTLDCPQQVFDDVIKAAKTLEPPDELDTILLLSEGELKYQLPVGELNYPDVCP